MNFSKTPPPSVNLPLSKLYLARNHVLVRIPQPVKETPGGLALPESAQRVESAMAPIVAVADFDDDKIAECALGTPALGRLVVLGAGMVSTPDFSIDEDEYRILDWEELTHVWDAE